MAAETVGETADDRGREAVWSLEREASRIDAQDRGAETEVRE
jgi:hypothetical protein